MKKSSFSKQLVEREIKYINNIYAASHECSHQDAVNEFASVNGDEFGDFVHPSNGDTVKIRDIYKEDGKTVVSDWICVVVKLGG